MAKRGDVRINKYAGLCITCEQHIGAGEGRIRLTAYGWKLEHIPSRWIGPPAGGSAIGKDGNGSFVGGCPKVPATV